MSLNVPKSAVNVLDEFCRKKIKPPAQYKFELCDNEYSCTVTSFDETKTAKAKSKKKAKAEAAEKLINHLRDMEMFKSDKAHLEVPPKIVQTTNEGEHNPTTNDQPEVNYVGKLLEHCTKQKLPPATFETIENTAKEGNQNEMWIKCTVNNVEKVGTGRNKKQAKHKAAMEVLKELTAERKDNGKLDESAVKLVQTGVESSPPSLNNKENGKFNGSPSKQMKVDDESLPSSVDVEDNVSQVDKIGNNYVRVN